MNDYNITTITSCSNAISNDYYLNQYPVVFSQYLRWVRLPYSMSREEAEEFLGTKLDPAGSMDFILSGYWFDNPSRYFRDWGKLNFVWQDFPPGYNPNVNFIPSGPRWTISGSLNISPPTKDSELKAESLVVMKTRALLKSKGQNDYIPETKADVDRFLSKVKANERITL